MYSIQKSVSIAANSTNNNILSGEIFEFVPEELDLKVLLTQSATGLKVDIYADSDAVATNVEPNIRTGNPINPDDLVAEFGVEEKTRLSIKVTNTTGGALTLYYIVRGE